MGYIGKIPSAVPLTSADITDNVITSAKIVDGTITNTDIASSIITGQTAETSIAGGDSILIYDDSATALRKMTRTNFVAGIGGATAGQVIQVVTATDSTERTTTSTSYVTASNTMSVSITPSSTSNKILILISSSVGNTSAYDVYSTVYRDATNLGGASGFMFSSGTGASSNMNSNSFNYLDSPSTTSSITYQFYFKTNSGTAYINRAGATGVITVLEIKG